MLPIINGVTKQMEGKELFTKKEVIDFIARTFVDMDEEVKRKKDEQKNTIKRSDDKCFTPNQVKRNSIKKSCL